MQNLYKQLKPKFRKALNENCKKYESVSRIKYMLMSKTLWQELSIANIKDLVLWANLDTRKLTIDGMLYGDEIIKQ
tara:strand:- start:355 stop:582 length:228 start_codon:yes stop_codon:yes gene_type:complete